jgi:hypothetical protein
MPCVQIYDLSPKTQQTLPLLVHKRGQDVYGTVTQASIHTQIEEVHTYNTLSRRQSLRENKLDTYQPRHTQVRADDQQVRSSSGT